MMNSIDQKTIIPENGSKVKPQERDKIKLFLIKYSPYFKKVWDRRWKLLKINGIIAAVLLTILLFLVTPYYESSVVILPNLGGSMSDLNGLSDLASMAGVNIGNDTPTEIYENLVLSEAVLSKVIYRKYNTESFDKPVNLIEYFKIDTDNDLTPQKAQRKAFLKAYKILVKSKIETNIERLTKILTVTINMPESQLSADVANAVVESLDDFIQNKRKSFATKQKEYIEKRINQVKDSLSIAENKLKSFRDKNRIVNLSPNLLLEQSRLERTVEIQQAIFVELTKQLEIARIDEIRDTPVVNYREDAKDPIKKAGPPRTKIFIILLFLSLLFSSVFYMFKPKLKVYWDLIKSRE